MLGHSLTPYTKINSKWIKDLNVRPDTIKLLEENIGKTLYDTNCSNIFLYPPPRIMKIKTKINKWGTNFAKQRKAKTKSKDIPQNWRKYLQMKRLTRD